MFNSTKHLKRMIYMKEALDKLSFKQILGYSIQAEKNAHEFYMRLSNATSDLVSKRYLSLAEDEKVHKLELVKFHKKLFGDENIEIPKGKGLPPHEGDIELENVRNLIEALDAAIESERNAYKIYTYLAKNKPEHKRFFEYLAMMEHGHQESLKAEKKMYEASVDTKEIKVDEKPSIWIREEMENVSSKVR